MMLIVSLLFVVLGLWLSTGLKVCGENERIIVLRFGRMLPISGPGLLFVLPAIDRAIRIELEDRGEVITADRVKVKGIEIPFVAERHLTPGSLVRVVGFKDKMSASAARVAPETDQRPEFHCEKCGHVNRV